MTDMGADGLDAWLARQERVSRQALRACVSAEGFRHERPGFGQVVDAAPGSVLASRHKARWDPEPDYAYHWVRDAAVVMRLAPLLAQDEPETWRTRVEDYIAFSLRMATRPSPETNPLRATTRPDFQRFLRPDAELAALRGEKLLGEPRANIDGSVDVERWSRPQHDGPALRALSCMTAMAAGAAGTDALLALDLGYTLGHAAAACIGPWEEEGEHELHAFTLMAQRAALRMAVAHGRPEGARADVALAHIEAALEGLVDATSGVLGARAGGRPGTSDAAVILGALLTDPEDDRFGPTDPRVLGAAAWLIDWSRQSFAINRDGAPAIGRGPDDRFFGGNPWVPTTLGMAELHFALAERFLAGPSVPDAAVASALFRRAADGGPAAPSGDSGAMARWLVAGGEAFLATLRRHVPGDGRLPEQIHRETGAPVSCPDLSWSHAALVSAAHARLRARERLCGQG
ncbi:hypothetical protein H0I76_03845 [Limibaculum sp. M0105]|uniref:glucan 1,4-alpha-glucosidase n=1 Tax=Thermohalobaculum xanthum TaxID=2753746 RepID=A0A8J7M4U7_9RHOB|nr:glycoside hydrolase family 15 protein [Thermohalobaculum xanthum]MBK0398313.1 hypothetical protein [Thermohalobaculum xanthum]